MEETSLTRFYKTKGDKKIPHGKLRKTWQIEDCKKGETQKDVQDREKCGINWLEKPQLPCLMPVRSIYTWGFQKVKELTQYIV